jgi:hypothetical protein
MNNNSYVTKYYKGRCLYTSEGIVPVKPRMETAVEQVMIGVAVAVVVAVILLAIFGG